MGHQKGIFAAITAAVMFAGPAQSADTDASSRSVSLKAPVIVIDPGHSGKDVKSVDPETGLTDHDYANHPEMEEMYRVAQAVGARLAQAGYKVIYTKSNVNETVSLRERATIAKQARAALGVSIHNDHGRQFSDFAQVTPQRAGEWRGGSASKPKAVFNNRELAAVSQSYAKIFAVERAKTEGHPVKIEALNFAHRAGIEPGNIAQVSLFAGSGKNAVPWEYNEVGGIGFGKEQESEYVEGLVNAIKQCIRPN